VPLAWRLPVTLFGVSAMVSGEACKRWGRGAELGRRSSWDFELLWFCMESSSVAKVPGPFDFDRY
jgi:hypothetical protein